MESGLIDLIKTLLLRDKLVINEDFLEVIPYLLYSNSLLTLKTNTEKCSQLSWFHIGLVH